MEDAKSSWLDWLGIYLRGFAMGAADVVPGVSGGTIAFITGIYARLIGAISSVDAEFFRRVTRLQWRQAWHHLDASFLVCLFGGILSSIVSLSHLVSYLLAHHEVLVWSFFVGLVLASSIVLLRDIDHWQWAKVALLIVGIVAALLINMLRPTQVDPSLGYIFVCGMIAICAMLVPGISGSFLLLIFGVYAAVLEAIKSFDLTVIAVFASGALIGLLSFSKLLNWALARAQSHIFALLTGFLVGSVSLIWPWKIATDEFMGDEPRMANVWPAEYSAHTGEPAQMFVALALATAAVAIVLVLGRVKPQR